MFNQGSRRPMDIAFAVRLAHVHTQTHIRSDSRNIWCGCQWRATARNNRRRRCLPTLTASSSAALWVRVR